LLACSFRTRNSKQIGQGANDANATNSHPFRPLGAARRRLRQRRQSQKRVKRQSKRGSNFGVNGGGSRARRGEEKLGQIGRRPARERCQGDGSGEIGRGWIAYRPTDFRRGGRARLTPSP